MAGTKLSDRGEHRSGGGERPCRERGPTSEPGRRRLLHRQGTRAQSSPRLPKGRGRAVSPPQRDHPRIGPPGRVGAEPVSSLLPADRGPVGGRWRSSPLRVAAAVAGRRQPRPAARVHSRRRTLRSDGDHRSLGRPPGVSELRADFRRRPERGDRDQPVRKLARRRFPPGFPDRAVRRLRRFTAPGLFRNHRDVRHQQPRQGGRLPDGNQEDGQSVRPRRFRRGLVVLHLPQNLSRRLPEDRRKLRP